MVKKQNNFSKPYQFNSCSAASGLPFDLYKDQISLDGFFGTVCKKYNYFAF